MKILYARHFLALLALLESIQDKYWLTVDPADWEVFEDQAKPQLSK